MSGETFNDASMLEIFRSEVETHVEVLTAGLLALERNPTDTGHIDEMMRGAHSIKGAARIVGIDPAVRVAHVMEDGFIEAQKGNLTLRPEHVDVLLRGVDLLNRIANATKDAAVSWDNFNPEAEITVKDISSVLSGKSPPNPLPLPPTRPPSQPMERQADAASTSSKDETTILFPVMLDASTAEKMRLELIASLDAGAKLVQFDLTQMKDLDATGLSFLAAVPSFVAQENARVELIGGAAPLIEVLTALGIDRLYSTGGKSLP